MEIAAFVKPAATGVGDGSTVANAAAFTAIPTLLGSIADGERIGVLAGYGTYTSSILSISAGSSDPNLPKLVIGVNDEGDPARVPPLIKGTRTDPWDEGATVGSETFRLLVGSDNLFFKNLHFRAIGNGCIRVGGPIVNLRIEDCTAWNVVRFLENNISGGATSAEIVGLRMRRVHCWGYGRALSRLRYNFDDVIIEDCIADSQMFDKEVFAVGYDFSSGGTNRTVNAVIRRCLSANNVATDLESDYWQGDGFVCEAEHDGIRFEDCVSHGNADAGFDVKANAQFVRCRSYDNKKNYRIWGNSTLENCESLRPYRRGGTGENGLHIDAPGTVATASTLTNCTLDSDLPEHTMFRVLTTGSTVVMNGGSMHRHADSTLLAAESNGTVTRNGVDETFY